LGVSCATLSGTQHDGQFLARFRLIGEGSGG
jgi:hypothetical protein